MHRILPNVLFLLIIFILATAFPLSTDILSLNLSTTIVENPIDDIVVPAKLEPVLPTEHDRYAFENISFEIHSSTGLFPAAVLSDYEIIVLQHGMAIERIALMDLSPNFIDRGEGKKLVTLPKSQLLDSRASGYYTFSIVYNEDVLDYTWFGSNMVYDKTMLRTSNSLSSGQLNFTLFFPTSDYKHVVPITRMVPLPSNRWRALYTALVNGPKNGLGLTELVPAVPYAPNIRISQSVANIYMYSANMTGYEDKFPTVIDAITKTFMTLGPLDGVKFFVNDSSATYSGSDLTQTYTQDAVSSVFLGYSHNSDFMMLLPIKLESATFEERVDEIWQSLKLTRETLNNIQGIIQVIPDEVQLLSHTNENGVLTLDVSEPFEQLFESQIEYRNLLVYSILYSYTSLPEVDSVILTVNGSPYKGADFDFTTSIVPNRFYNMEP